MYSLVSRFSGDINDFYFKGVPLSSLPLPIYFDIVKKIPFKADDYGVEVVTRPFHLFSAPWIGWDCKKKAIAIASWLAQNHIPFKFTAVSRLPSGEIHHVIVEAQGANGWIELDATYPSNEFAVPQEWTAKEDLPADFDGFLSGAAKLVSMYGDGPTSQALAQDFLNGMRQVSPEQMGSATVAAVVGIVVAIVSAVSGVTAAIIGAVSGKRQQERQIAAAKKLAEAQAKQIEERYEQEKAIAQQVAEAQGKSALPGWLIPAAAALGLFALL